MNLTREEMAKYVVEYHNQKGCFPTTIQKSENAVYKLMKEIVSPTSKNPYHVIQYRFGAYTLGVKFLGQMRMDKQGLPSLYIYSYGGYDMADDTDSIDRAYAKHERSMLAGH